MINIILIILILISLHFLLNKNNNKEIILNESFLNNPNANYCKFNYDDINFNYEINPKIINDNDNVNKINYNIIKSWQPNIYYDNKTKQNKTFNDNNNFLENNIIYKKDNNNENNDNKTIREVYDNKILNFKKNIPNKIKNNNNIIECGSNLHILSPNEWNYNDEKPENGGEIKNGLYAYDDLINGGVALC